MGSIRDSQWRKSYMLEFLKNGEAEEVFTFAVPPESEDFQFPQRLTETKTFAGSIFEDYGSDTYKIVLSGTTVNEEKKYIYKGSKAAQYLTGAEEIFGLQEIVRKWSEDASDADKKVYLYDLSKTGIQDGGTSAALRGWWRVFIKDLKIKRDKSNPFAFKYTLEMAACEDSEKAESASLPSAAEIAASISAETGALSSQLATASGAGEAIGGVDSAASAMEAAYG